MLDINSLKFFIVSANRRNNSNWPLFRRYQVDYGICISIGMICKCLSNPKKKFAEFALSNFNSLQFLWSVNYTLCVFSEHIELHMKNLNLYYVNFTIIKKQQITMSYWKTTSTEDKRIFSCFKMRSWAHMSQVCFFYLL